MVDDRLKRVHVVGARAKGNGFVVVLSDPVRDAAGKALRADTWEVAWDAWIAASADVAKL